MFITSFGIVKAEHLLPVLVSAVTLRQPWLVRYVDWFYYIYAHCSGSVGYLWISQTALPSESAGFAVLGWALNYQLWDLHNNHLLLPLKQMWSQHPQNKWERKGLSLEEGCIPTICMDWKRFYGPDIFSNGFAFKQLSGRQFLSLFFFLAEFVPISCHGDQKGAWQILWGNRWEKCFKCMGVPN